MDRILRQLIAISMAVLGLHWAVISAQEVEIAPTRLGSLLGDDDTVTTAEIQAALDELPRLPNLDDDIRSRVTELYQTALKSLEGAAQVINRRTEFERLTQTIDQQLQDTAAQLVQLANERAIVDENLTVEQLQQLVGQYQVDLERRRRELATAEAEPERQRVRLAEMMTRSGERQRQIDEIRQQLSLSAAPGEPQIVAKARAIQLTAQRQLLELEQQRAEAEKTWYLTATSLLPEQIKLASQHARLANDRWQLAQKTLQRRQESEAQRIKRETQEEIDAAPPAFAGLAKENGSLAEDYRAQLERNSLFHSRWRQVQERFSDINSQFEVTVERVKSVGLTDALGVHLKEIRQSLVGQRAANRPESSLKDDMSRLRVDSFRRQDNLTSWKSVAEATESEIREARLAPSEAEAAQPFVEKLVARRQQLNQEMVALNRQLLDNMINLDTTQRELQSLIDRFIAYIDENIIWIPSCAPLGLSDLSLLGEAAAWLFHPASWQAVVSQVLEGIIQRPLTLLGFILSLALLFGLHGRFRRLVLDSSEEARRGRCTSMLPTFNALLATLLMSARWPMMFAFLGWLLRTAWPANEFTHAWGQGMLSVALMIAPFEMLRLTCRQNGLAAAHFDWSDSIRVFLQRHVRWIYAIAVPAVAIMVAMEYQAIDDYRNSLGRIAAMVVFLVAIWFLHLALRPNGPIFEQSGLSNPNGLIFRYRVFIYLIVLAIPVTLLVLATAGYYYTAYKLAGCLERTAVLAVALILICGLAFRWLLIRRRVIAIEELRKLRAQQLAGASGSSGTAPTNIELQDAPAIDLASVSQQAKEVVVFLLTIFGLMTMWWIWQDVLPALGMLRRVQLWESTVGQATIPVTLADMVYALAILVVVFLLTKNLPGVLNLVFHNFLRLDAGARYAAMTLIRYVITIVGLIVALNFLSIAWSQYGWLVAAASVGLGFGLQEIFANFVSGIILLFERPVRVGDVVTLDNQTGVVTRIQMRATTITNFDHQELVVPNKNLVTGTLLNWTLSNGTSRLVLEVGVSYDADPAQVCALLADEVAGNPDILAEPKPSALFDRFGDSALIFLVRCYTNNFESRTRIRHELNSRILARLTEAGIKIPYPQREVHLHS